MAYTAVQFQMDAEMKKMMEDTCRRMGLTMASAFTAFAAKVIMEQRIPFEISARTADLDLLRRIEDARLGRNMIEHDLIEVD